MWYLYIMKYDSLIKKNEILPLATAWMDLEGILLSDEPSVCPQEGPR